MTVRKTKAQLVEEVHDLQKKTKLLESQLYDSQREVKAVKDVARNQEQLIALHNNKIIKVAAIISTQLKCSYPPDCDEYGNERIRLPKDQTLEERWVNLVLQEVLS